MRHLRRTGFNGVSVPSTDRAPQAFRSSLRRYPQALPSRPTSYLFPPTNHIAALLLRCAHQAFRGTRRTGGAA